MTTEATQTQATETTETETPEAPKQSLREQLVASLKERRAAGEEEPAKEKPKGEPKKDAAKDAKDEKADEKPKEERSEADELKSQRREFAKFQRKKAAELQAREVDIQTRETHAKEQNALFERDPIAWLKSRGVDVRQTLIKLAEEDAEDPKDRKLRELDERQKKLEEKEAREQQEAESRERQQRAQGQIAQVITREFKASDPEDFPNLSKFKADRVGQVAMEHAVNHYRRTGIELAPGQVLRILEKQLADEADDANPSGRRPDQDRSERKAKPVNPEAKAPRPKPATDVTNRETRIRREAKSGFDREGTRERLIEMTRERIRH